MTAKDLGQKQLAINIELEGDFSREENAEILAAASAAYRLDNNSIEIGYSKHGFRLRGNYNPSDNLDIRAEAEGTKARSRGKISIRHWW